MEQNQNGGGQVYRAKGAGSLKAFFPAWREQLGTLLRALPAGIVLALAGLVYLSVDSKYLGTAVLPFGFLTVYHYRFKLFHAEVGYALGRGAKQNLLLAPAVLGNALGLLLVPLLLSYTRVFEKLSTRAQKVMETRLADTAFSVFLLAVLCGVLMFVSVDGFKNAEIGWMRFLLLFLPVMAFVYCGLEHSALDLFYVTVGGLWSLRAVWYMIVITVGNALGALVIPAFYFVYRRFFLKKA